jgi:hypothetical protein
LIPVGEGEPTRVLAHGAKKRYTAPIWSALVFAFLTFFSGNGGAKFSEKTGFLQALRMEEPDNCDAETIANLLRKGWLCQIATVRYLVKGRVRAGKESALLRAIEQGTIIRHSGLVIARVLFHCEHEKKLPTHLRIMMRQFVS